MIFHEGRCPMCGVIGREFESMRVCPCGTVFNEFGIILALREHRDELQFN